MTIFRQLLKEFWLPLVVALAWSAINLRGAFNTDWSITKFINIAAPTFFFVSWLTAQYFRVKKQEHVSSSLSTIEQRVDTVLGRVEKQTADLTYITNARILQTFDECIDALREANEELADKSRQLKLTKQIDVEQFLLHRGNPFYATRRHVGMLVNYAAHIIEIGQHEALEARFTRGAHHIEELAGHVGVFCRRLNHFGIAWKTERCCELIGQISSRVEQFQMTQLKHSRYFAGGYKGGQNLDEVLSSHVRELRKLCA